GHLYCRMRDLHFNSSRWMPIPRVSAAAVLGCVRESGIGRRIRSGALVAGRPPRLVRTTRPPRRRSGSSVLSLHVPLRRLPLLSPSGAFSRLRVAPGPPVDLLSPPLARDLLCRALDLQPEQ